MARITIHFKDTLVGAVKQRAALRRQSVSGYLELLIARDLGLPTIESLTPLPPAAPVQAVAEAQAPYHAAPPPPPATLEAALAAKARAAAAEREMLHAHPTAAPVAGNRSVPRKGVPVHPAG